MKKSELKKLIKEELLNENASKQFDIEYKHALKQLLEIKSMLDKFAKNYITTDDHDYSGVNFLRKINNGLRTAWSELKYGKVERK